MAAFVNDFGNAGFRAETWDEKRHLHRKGGCFLLQTLWNESWDEKGFHPLLASPFRIVS